MHLSYTGSLRHFNPRSSCEERPRESSKGGHARYFNPRSSCEERPKNTDYLIIADPFQSTLLMRGATPVLAADREVQFISIHAPHARSDNASKNMNQAIQIISIHAPHARSDIVADSQIRLPLLISIHAPHARSDQEGDHRRRCPADISIHAPHARSDVDRALDSSLVIISIHAPHARSDSTVAFAAFLRVAFQSTLLMRGATCGSGDGFWRHMEISIHAPHARSDLQELPWP